MKHFAIISIFILLMTGCRETLGPAGLVVSESEISCQAEGGEFLIEIEGRPDWTTDNTADWISVRRINGNASIHIDKNEGESRQTTVGFLTDARKQAEITITQEHSETFSISSKSHQISYQGGKFYITVTCFTDWKAESDSEWLSLERTSGAGISEVQISVAMNEKPEEREGKITFISGNKSIVLAVIQSLKPYVEVEKQIIESDGDGGQYKVLYLSHSTVETSSSVEWIRIISTDETINKVSFEVMRNLGESREGRIRISSTMDENIFSEITVRQGPKIDHPKLLIAEGPYLVLHSKESISLTPVFEDMSDHSLKWSSDRPETATVDENGHVTIHSGGTCTITARNSHHNLEASITLDIRPKAEGMSVKFGGQDMNEDPVAVRFVGETIVISVKMDPSDAYSEDLTFFSSDEEIAQIDGNTIRCLKAGKAEIFIESTYQSLRQSFILTVIE